MSKYYPTWSEAKLAISALKILGADEYMRRYKEDPRLPPNPYDIYPEGQSQKFFLDTQKYHPYPTWQEASEAAVSLGLKGQSQYQKGYHADPRLMSNPHRTYADFPSWGTFLKTGNPTPPKRSEKMYDSWDEAALGARKLRIRTKTEYKRRYKEDLKLPSNPDEAYSKDWTGWPRFLGTRFRHSTRRIKK